jgi:hypothetical protein
MDNLEYYALDTREFNTKPIQIENNFFIDTRLPLQQQIQGSNGHILRKQQVDNPFSSRLNFPVKENVVYTNDMSGVNTKLIKKVPVKGTVVPW